MTSLFVASWVPMTSSVLVTLITSCDSLVKSTVTSSCFSLMLATKVLNPWFHVFKNREFKHVIKTFSKCLPDRTKVHPRNDIYFSTLGGTE